MTDENSDWIYCRLIDRGTFMLPRKEFWFGQVELCSNAEDDERCVAALRDSMRAYAVSESEDGWSRLVRARIVLLGMTQEEARRFGDTSVRETVRLFNAHLAQWMPVRETDAGYLFNLTTRVTVPLLPARPERNRSGAFAILDSYAVHPNHILNTLLVTGPEVYGELGLAFRRCAHWRDLAKGAEDDSERLLLNWMGAECLAKLGANDVVAPRLLAAVGLPSGPLARRRSAPAARAIAALPGARPWRRKLEAMFDRLRDARNRIVHSGYRHVDLVSHLSDEERECAKEVLPITTKCLSDMALMALELRHTSLREMWSTYPTAIAPSGVVARATWFLGRLDAFARTGSALPRLRW